MSENQSVANQKAPKEIDAIFEDLEREAPQWEPTRCCQGCTETRRVEPWPPTSALLYFAASVIVVLPIFWLSLWSLGVLLVSASTLMLIVAIQHSYRWLRDRWVGFHVVVGRDTNGRVHIHRTNPYNGPIWLSDGELLFDRDEKGNPFRLDRNQALLQINLWGRGRNHTRNCRWEVVDVSSYPYFFVTLQDPNGMRISCSLRSTEFPTFLRFLELNRSLGWALGSEESASKYLQSILAVLPKQIREAKESLGKSKHAQIIREFLEDVGNEHMRLDLLSVRDPELEEKLTRHWKYLCEKKTMQEES